MILPDLTVGVLDADVPTNRISYAKILPDNYADYLRAGERLPVLCLDQEEKAIVKDLSSLHRPPIANGSISVMVQYLINPLRKELMRW